MAQLQSLRQIKPNSRFLGKTTHFFYTDIFWHCLPLSSHLLILHGNADPIINLDRKKTFNAVFFYFFQCRWRLRWTSLARSNENFFFFQMPFQFFSSLRNYRFSKKTRPNTLFGLFRFQAAAAGGQFQNLSVLKLLLEWKFHFFKYRPSFIEQL